MWYFKLYLSFFSFFFPHSWQRRDYSFLTKFLPPKQEYVISVRMTNIQTELYEKYLELSGQGLDGVFSNKGARLFTDYQNLMKIWTHPWVLKLAEIRDEMKVNFISHFSFMTFFFFSFSSDSESYQSLKCCLLSRNPRWTVLLVTFCYTPSV